MASHVSSHNTAAVGYSISHVRQKPSEWLVPLRVALLTGKRWHQRRASAHRPAGWQQTAALRRCCNPPMANGTGLGFGRARRVLRCVAPRMSRTAARRMFSREDLEAQTRGVDCRKDGGVLDEIPAAYKDIDEVMANQSDLVEIVHTLKQLVCVKG